MTALAVLCHLNPHKHIKPSGLTISFILEGVEKCTCLNHIHVAINATWFAVHQILHILPLVCVWSCMESCKSKEECIYRNAILNGRFLLLKDSILRNNCLRWRKQSYLKQRLQKSVWKECRLCSLCTDLAFGPSMLGVHSGGRAPGSCCSVSSLYLQKDNISQNMITTHQILMQMEASHYFPFKFIRTIESSYSEELFSNILFFEFFSWTFIRKHGRNGFKDFIRGKLWSVIVVTCCIQ